jgi:glycine betaine transporter
VLRNPLLIVALLLTIAVAVWGIVNPAGLTAFASANVERVFASRGWFVMLASSTLLLASIWLALSRYGRIKLGRDDDRPEFSTVSWLTMMFAAGMGVGLLFYGAAEPLSHYRFLSRGMEPAVAADNATFVTLFHWGLHAWAIYGFTALVIAYFTFRRGTPQLPGAPIKEVYGDNRWTRAVGGLIDLLSIYAIAIGLAGSVALGVFQVSYGIAALLGLEGAGPWLVAGVFVALVLAYLPPLTVDLGSGMARLSNLAIGITVVLMIYLVLIGPTAGLMNGIMDGIGSYIGQVIPQGFRTYAHFGREVETWFHGWTLNYMVWWLAWSPFVGVFIARISRGRTIREFLSGVLLVPTGFSILWFGVLGGMGFHQAAAGALDPAIVDTDIDGTTFALLDTVPLSALTTLAVIVAAFLFIVTSVVSAAYVLAGFSSGGSTEPGTRLKLLWGAILGALGLALILSGDSAAVRQVIAMSAAPFVFIVLLLLIAFLRRLRSEEGA